MDLFIKTTLLALSALCCVHAGYFAYPQRPDRPPWHRPRPQPGSSEHDTIVFPERPNQYGVPGEQSRPGGVQSRPGGMQSRPGGMQVLFSWKQVDFDFPSNKVREDMIRDQRFIPLNNLILDVDVYGEGSQRKVFVTVPRVRPGVPATLATVSSKRRGGANLLAPFPDWRANTPSTDGCKDNLITSVFRTHVDPCGRLWVLDSGNNNAFAGSGSSIVCPPKVMIYDLRNNNRLLGTYRIPDNMIANNTLLVTIVVDTRTSDCSDAHAYIADSIAYKMIVFNLRTRRFWRLNSILFNPYPDQSTFTVNGVSFDLSGGVFGLALGPVFGRERRLYFHCIDSVRQSWVDSSDLRNMSLWETNMNAKPRAFNLFRGSRSSQSAAATTTDDGIMFFGLIGSNEIACWNTEDKFGKKNIVVLAKDVTTLQFNSGIKVYGNKLYAATNRLQNYLNQRVVAAEENYRVLEGDVQQMTRGTKCQAAGGGDPLFFPESDWLDTSNDVLDYLRPQHRPQHHPQHPDRRRPDYSQSDDHDQLIPVIYS